jgi:hypothetical protein
VLRPDDAGPAPRYYQKAIRSRTPEAQLSNPQQPQQQLPQEQSLEHRQWLHEQNMRLAERAHDTVTDYASKTNIAAIEVASLTLRTAMIINGGAAISVLAFIGGLASRDKVSLQAITQTAGTLVWFASGVAAATLSMGLAYLTIFSIAQDATFRLKTFQDPYLQETDKSRAYKRTAEIFRWLAVAGAIGSLAAHDRPNKSPRLYSASGRFFSIAKLSNL